MMLHARFRIPHSAIRIPTMPAVHLNISEVPVIISANSPRLIRLFADYFRYYDPEIEASADGRDCLHAQDGIAPLVIELKVRRELPPREKLIPPRAELFSQTGVVRLWREQIEAQSAEATERFYFDLGVAAFRVEPRLNRAIGLIAPQALEYPHILANTYALFALLLLLRSRNLYHLHAAAVVSPQDELWLICGSQRSGKTTLTTALGIAGWRPVSDDSLLISFDGEAPRVAALKKYFHIGDELLARWRQLDGIARRHQYLDRTCVQGLEFFGTERLTEMRFREIDHIVLPEITGEKQSRVEPIPRGEALLRLAEQSMFFQLWPEHTRRQWEALTKLTATASCHRLLAGRDILDDPLRAAEITPGAAKL
ncbi:MAG: hypothetical protein AB7U82_06600 [Blastocatellales bacterium]